MVCHLPPAGRHSVSDTSKTRPAPAPALELEVEATRAKIDRLKALREAREKAERDRADIANEKTRRARLRPR